MRAFSKTLYVETHGLDPLAEAPPCFGEKQVHRLLGYLIYKAMNDCMMGLRLGVDPDTKQSWLKFFGPIQYPPDHIPEKPDWWWNSEPQWWVLYPPLADDFPWALKCLVSRCFFSSVTPIRGTIPAKAQRRHFLLNLELTLPYSFELSWPEEQVRPFLSQYSGMEWPSDQPRAVAPDKYESAKDMARGA